MPSATVVATSEYHILTIILENHKYGEMEFSKKGELKNSRECLNTEVSLTKYGVVRSMGKV